MSEAPPALPGVTHRFVDAGGLLTHVAEAGEGDPLVLLHGWPQHWYCWRGLLPDLARRWRVVCIDLRGFGWTEAPPGGYDKEGLASDVLAALDALGIERFHLVGHDWGGFVGFLMALREPERVRGLVALAIVHPWLRRELLAPHAWRFAAYQALMLVPGLGPLATGASPAYLETVFRLGGPGLEPRAVASYIATLRQPARAAAASRLYREFATRELRPILAGRYHGTRLRVPTTLLLGADDRVVRPELVGGWESHADDMEVGLVAGAGHFIPEDQPAAVLAAIESRFRPAARRPAPARRAPRRRPPAGGTGARTPAPG